MISEQEKKEPEKAAGSCAWGDAATVIPWTSYVFFGDKSLLAKEYGNMKMWIDYIHAVESVCGIMVFILQTGLLLTISTKTAVWEEQIPIMWQAAIISTPQS